MNDKLNRLIDSEVGKDNGSHLPDIEGVSWSNVLVLIESRREGVPWLRPAFELMQETPLTFREPGEFSCRANRGVDDASLFQLNHWIESTPTPLPSNARIVNARDVLLGRAQQCQRQRGLLPNLLAVDFYRTGDLFEVVDELNGVAPDPLSARGS